MSRADAHESGKNLIEELQAEVERLKIENASLRNSASTKIFPSTRISTAPPEPSDETRHNLSREEIERYSRQLLLNNGFGVTGQCALLSARVLVIGAGGIASSALLYLAGAGVGHITIVDYDVVERSNLHRQVIHRDRDVGLNKAHSAQRAVSDLNGNIRCEAIEAEFHEGNALELVVRHDCIIDCSDNPKTRYLVNDACVLAQKNLVSGSAVESEGQLTVYNYKNGPCYRCLYPTPAVSAGCRACADAGVLGPIPGLIGILQAMECIKAITGVGDVMHERFLMYDGLQCAFYTITKPPRRSDCPTCGDAPTICTMQDSADTLLAAKGPRRALQVPELPRELELSCQEYSSMRQSGDVHLLLDVRVSAQFEMCHLDNAISIPLAHLRSSLDHVDRLCREAIGDKSPSIIICICRRGIDSAEATEFLHAARSTRPSLPPVRNVRGGLSAWAQQIDPSFPTY